MDYILKKLINYSNLHNQAYLKTIRRWFGKEIYPKIQNDVVAECTAQIECITLFKHRFEASLFLQYTIKDRDKFIGEGAHRDSEAVSQIIDHFICNVLTPEMADYCWIYNINHSASYPILYKLKRGKTKDDISLTQSNYFTDLLPQIITEAKRHVFSGCYISYARVMPLDSDYWINKEGGDMTKDEVSLLRSQYDNMELEELSVLYFKNKQKEMIEASHEGSFSPYKGTIITYKVDAGNLKIAWTGLDVSGRLKIIRADDKGLPTDPRSGVMIADSKYKNGQIIDYNIPRGRPIHYSVIRECFEGDQVKFSALARFSVMLAEEQKKEEEKKEKEEDNTPLKEYIKTKAFETAKKKIDIEFKVNEEIDAFKVDMEKRRRLAKARDQFAREFLDGKELDQLTEADKKMYEELMILIDFQIRQFTTRK